MARTRGSVAVQSGFPEAAVRGGVSIASESVRASIEVMQGESRQRDDTTSFTNPSISARRSLSWCAHWPWGTMSTEAVNELQERGVLGWPSIQWDARPGDRVGTRSVVQTVTENDRGESWPWWRTQDQLPLTRWCRSARGRGNITQQRRCELGARRPDPWVTWERECVRTSRRESLNSTVLGDGSSDGSCCIGAVWEERRHEVNDELVKDICSQQTIHRRMSLVVNAIRRQGETDGDGEVKRKERAVPTAGRIDQEEQERAWPTARSVIDQKQQEQSGTRSQYSRGSRRTWRCGLWRRSEGVAPFYLVFFYMIFRFWLVWSTTGCPVLSSTLQIDTGTGEVSLSTRSSLSRVSLSLDIAVGDEDELEEDVRE